MFCITEPNPWGPVMQAVQWTTSVIMMCKSRAWCSLLDYHIRLNNNHGVFWLLLWLLLEPSLIDFSFGKIHQARLQLKGIESTKGYDLRVDSQLFVGAGLRNTCTHQWLRPRHTCSVDPDITNKVHEKKMLTMLIVCQASTLWSYATRNEIELVNFERVPLRSCKGWWWWWWWWDLK